MQQVEARVAAARNEPKWQHDELHGLMAELQPRWQRFEQLAPRLLAEVIRPRVEKLTSYFSNAKLMKDDVGQQCACWSGYGDSKPNHEPIPSDTYRATFVV